MKSKSLILIVIACGCGLVASIGISQVMDRGGGGAQIETAKILVALNDININDKFDAQNVKLEDWPKDRLPEGALSSLDDVKDQFSGSRLYKGEPILKAKLTNTQGQKTTIPPGFRVVPIRVEHGVITELVQPGDRVDVLAFLQKSPEIPTTTTKTVLTDVRIWAVNDKTERAKDKESETIQARTVSVLVKPEQVQRLMLAMELGKIKLSLRRPDDKTTVDGADGSSIGDLFSGSNQGASDPTPDSKGSFVDLLKGQATPPTTAPATTQVAAVATARVPIKKMVIHTPEGTKLYQWFNENDPPEIVVLGETAEPATAPVVSAPAAKVEDKNSGQTDDESDDKNK